MKLWLHMLNMLGEAFLMICLTAYCLAVTLVITALLIIFGTLEALLFRTRRVQWGLHKTNEFLLPWADRIVHSMMDQWREDIEDGME